MIIGDRLRALREEKKFSQGDVEKRMRTKAQREQARAYNTKLRLEVFSH
jgi:transcriptional regulator with XRE-family HTH domain